MKWTADFGSRSTASTSPKTIRAVACVSTEGDEGGGDTGARGRERLRSDAVGWQVRPGRLEHTLLTMADSMKEQKDLCALRHVPLGSRA